MVKEKKGRELIRLLCEKNELPEMIVFEELRDLSLKFNLNIDEITLEDIRHMLMDYLDEAFDIEEGMLEEDSALIQ